MVQTYGHRELLHALTPRRENVSVSAVYVAILIVTNLLGIQCIVNAVTVTGTISLL